MSGAGDVLAFVVPGPPQPGATASCSRTIRTSTRCACSAGSPASAPAWRSACAGAPSRGRRDPGPRRGAGEPDRDAGGPERRALFLVARLLLDLVNDFRKELKGV